MKLLFGTLIRACNVVAYSHTVVGSAGFEIMKAMPTWLRSYPSTPVEFHAHSVGGF